MAKRLAWIAFIGTIILIIGMPAAVAAPKSGHTKSGPTHTHPPHAAANATRGMNRVGSPGTWKEHGHVPAAVSAPQGYSPSDPDANGNGGADKPGALGGFNDDRDGNNGCGNDSDREDDNNGWCGLKPKSHVPSPPSGPPTPPLIPPVATGPQVLGIGPVTHAAPLARTGGDVGDLLYAGSSFVLIGISLRRRASSR